MVLSDYFQKMAEAGEAFICRIFGVMQFYTCKGARVKVSITGFEQLGERAIWRILGWFAFTFASHLMAALGTWDGVLRLRLKLDEARTFVLPVGAKPAMRFRC